MTSPRRTYLFLPLQSSFHVQYCLSCEATHALCIEIMDTVFDEYVIVLNDWGVNYAYSIYHESFTCRNRVHWVTRLKYFLHSQTENILGFGSLEISHLETD